MTFLTTVASEGGVSPMALTVSGTALAAGVMELSFHAKTGG